MRYKIGDKVRIKSIDWYNENKGNADKSNSVWCKDGEAWFFYHMSQYCGKIMTVKNVWAHSYTLEGSDSRWTDEMIEGLVEKKKKEYPKTYEECEKVLRYDSHRLNNMGVTVQGYKWELIRAFQILIICRDVYWKIAGEEMGLGKPWKPDWKNDEQGRYMIMIYENKLHKDRSIVGTNFILVFPTEEMRDAFYENFKELIEICKEFL